MYYKYCLEALVNRDILYLWIRNAVAVLRLGKQTSNGISIQIISVNMMENMEKYWINRCMFCCPFVLRQNYLVASYCNKSNLPSLIASVLFTFLQEIEQYGWISVQEEINYEQITRLHVCRWTTSPGQLECVKNKTNAITTFKNYASHFLKTFINAQNICVNIVQKHSTQKTEVDLLWQATILNHVCG